LATLIKNKIHLETAKGISVFKIANEWILPAALSCFYYLDSKYRSMGIDLTNLQLIFLCKKFLHKFFPHTGLKPWRCCLLFNRNFA